MSDVVTDPETGKIDYDIIMTGQTHTQVTNMRKILSILREMAKEQEMVPLQEVISAAETEGINRERARDLIARLERNGEFKHANLIGAVANLSQTTGATSERKIARTYGGCIISIN